MDLVKHMQEKQEIAEELHAQDMTNFKDSMMKELEIARNQVKQTKTEFAQKLELEVTEMERKHAETMRLEKERFAEELENAHRKSSAFPARIAELEAAIEMNDKAHQAELEQLRIEWASEVASLESKLYEEREACEISSVQSQRYTVALKRAMVVLEARASEPHTNVVYNYDKPDRVSEDQVGPDFIPRRGRVLANFRDGLEIEKIITTGPRQVHETTIRQHAEMMGIHGQLKKQRMATSLSRPQEEMGLLECSDESPKTDVEAVDESAEDLA
eukprot:scaffold3052_cov389-Prasinococcus_capsulatus_cf.AAC.18